ncbi:MAG TPA: hypothetical protein PKM48_04360 [Parvularculaceae bacterium]|nr:hypothetical protein [Parvularculaceae bacterium]
MRSIEAIFGGVLALVVLAAAIFMVSGGRWGSNSQSSTTGGSVIVSQPGAATPADAGRDVLCQCFDQGRDLAGSSVDVLSSQYRTGFESCRAVAGVKGGEAWTAGWNAKLSARPFQASCDSWLRSVGL